MSSPIELVSCDNCGVVDELRDWESASGSMYSFCKVCWVDIRDTEDELSTGGPVCEECHHKPATQLFNRLDGVSLDLCDACFGMADHEPISSQFCELCSESRARHPIRDATGERIYVCVPCFESSQNRKAPSRTICEECDRKWSTIVVTRDEKTTADVCEECYDAYWAPKDLDEDASSNPVESSWCACPLSCTLSGSSVCIVCECVVPPLLTFPD